MPSRNVGWFVTKGGKAVVLSAAKDPHVQVLRCAQDDRTAFPPFVTYVAKFRDLFRTRDQREAYRLRAYSLRRLLHWLTSLSLRAYQRIMNRIPPLSALM